VKPQLKKILRYAGYPVFYLAVFAIFLVVTFPHHRLKERIEAEFNARQPPAEGMHLSIDEMSGYWLTGVEAEGIKLTIPPGPPGENGKVKEPKVLEITEAHARVSLLRLLVGTTHVSFAADAFGGSLSGYTSDGGDARTIEIEMEEVAAGELPILAQAVGLPMAGTLSGTVELELPEGKLAQAVGHIELTGQGLAVGDGKAKIKNTIALPKLNLGELSLVAEATDGRLKIEKLSAKGKDAEVVGDGSIRLRDPFDSSLAELSLRFKFEDGYKNKNDMTRGLFGAPGSSMPGLFDLDPDNKRAKRPDGFYAWRLTGPLGKLDAKPAAMATPGSSSRGNRGFTR
jgi:type II secretion system protein N